MEHLVQLKGFENQNIVIQAAGLFSGTQLLVNGEPAPAGPKRGQLLLHRDNGEKAVVKFKNFFFDPFPNLIVDGEKVQVVEPLKWYQIVLALLPFILAVLGGLVGIVVGLPATMYNMRVFRSERSAVSKYVTATVVSVLSAVVVLGIAVAINS
ncbi:MAG: hypothetical protein AAF614_01000 [Chloroflexota bacterium]